MEHVNEHKEFYQADDHAAASLDAHQKLDEFTALIREVPLANSTLQELQSKFNAAMRQASDTTALQAFVRTPRNFNQNDESSAELDQLLLINQLDQKKQKQFNLQQVLAMVLRVVIAILLILLGFGMIIMPAPPYFEMFTLFYLSPNDGVTIMDVVSLIVAFTGIYLLVTTITKWRSKR